MIKFIIRSALVIVFAAIGFAIFANVLIILNTQKDVYHDINKVPHKKIALVLGTSKRTINGDTNSFFSHRMEAAARLLKQNKVEQLLVSGDNRTKYYNEPADMKKALLKLGVPETAIILDTAGYRTLESITRCAEVFKHTEITIVTQEFHAFRALYLSKKYNLNAVAYCAEEVSVYASSKVNIREFFARPKALIDIYLPGKSLESLSL